MSGKVQTITIAAFLIVVFFATGLIAYDVLFSKPVIMQGIVVEKIFIPSKNKAGGHVLPYGRYRTFDHSVTAEKHEQWIAFVKLDDGKVLKVNCHSNHYQTKQIGDTLHFKEYTGELLGIDYFSHNEEDEEIENAYP